MSKRKKVGFPTTPFLDVSLMIGLRPMLSHSLSFAPVIKQAAAPARNLSGSYSDRRGLYGYRGHPLVQVFFPKLRGKMALESGRI